MIIQHRTIRYYTVILEANRPRALARIQQTLRLLLNTVLHGIHLNVLIEKGDYNAQNYLSID